RQLAQANKVTLFALLLASYIALMSRVSGVQDLIVGIASSSRHSARWRGVVGYFINMLSVRAQLDDPMSFRELLLHVKNKVVAALSHQEYPAIRLVKQLHPQRDTRASTLFQIDFGLQVVARSSGILDLFVTSDPAVQVVLGELVFKPYDLRQQQGQFALTLDMVDDGARLHGVFKYQKSVISDSSARDLRDYLFALWVQIVSDPDIQVSEIVLMTEPERKRMNYWLSTMELRLG
ncbi:MAG: condensation domain-containing protein, partial [Myxococcota bacterium]